MRSRWVDFHEIKRTVGIQDALGIYGVHLKGSGVGVLRGQCPLPMHDSDCCNSFSINIHRNVWACHSRSCSAGRGGRVGGTVLDFVAFMEHCSIRDAALLLDHRFASSGPSRSSRAPLACPPKSNQPLSFALSNIRSDHPYLLARGFDGRTTANFGIGFYGGPGLLRGRIVIPIHDEAGNLIAYAGRSITGDIGSKYKFPPGFRKSAALFNIHRARPEARGELIIVEGFFDCLRVHQAGFPNVVALMGCTMSDSQVQMVRASCARVILIFDGDRAGVTGAVAAAHRLDGSGLSVCTVNVPEGRQPDNLSVKELCGSLQEAHRR